MSGPRGRWGTAMSAVSEQPSKARDQSLPSPLPQVLGDDTCVEVWFDGACARLPSGEAPLYGYGFRIKGAGLDFESSHVPIVFQVARTVMGLMGEPLTDDDLAAVPRSIRSIHVADLEGALAAMAHLKDKGYRGRVRLYGDSSSLMERLSAGITVRPDSADARAIVYREEWIKKLSAEFRSVNWVAIPSKQNALADELASSAVHEILERKRMYLKVSRTHAGESVAAILAGIFSELALPGDVSEAQLRSMVCPCGRCRRARSHPPGHREA